MPGCQMDIFRLSSELQPYSTPVLNTSMLGMWIFKDTSKHTLSLGRRMLPREAENGEGGLAGSGNS